LVLTVLLVVLPVFLVIGGGWIATRSGIFSASAVDGLMVYTQSFAVPCLLFRGLVDLDLGAAFDPGLLLSFYTGAIIAFAAAVLIERRIFRRRPGEAVAIGFGALFSNSVLLGLPIMTRAYGVDALAPNFAIISIHAPFCYVVGITAMEIARADGASLAATARTIARAVFRNGLMIALGRGFVVNLAGIPLPTPVRSAVDMIADSALPAALFALGGVFTRYAIRSSLGEAGTIATLSLLVHPAIVWTLATQVFDLPPEFVRGAVVTAAMAPGVNTYVFASLYARGQAQAASAILLATAVSVLTVSAWLALLGGVQ
jgi:malonate transporter and related proteins